MPAELRAGWGAAEFYTTDQVTAVIKRLGFQGPHVALAYAAFTTRADFGSVAPSAPAQIDYDAAREIMERAAPGVLAATYQQGPMSNAEAGNRYGVGGL